MIEAVAQNAEIRNFACGEAATQDGRLIIDVQIEPPLTEQCTSDVFVQYRDGQPMNTDALLRLSFSVHAPDTWAVAASFVDPHNSPDDSSTEGGFDEAIYYCHVMGVRVTRTEHGWRAWHDASWWQR